MAVISVLNKRRNIHVCLLLDVFFSVSTRNTFPFNNSIKRFAIRLTSMRVLTYLASGERAKPLLQMVHNLIFTATTYWLNSISVMVAMVVLLIITSRIPMSHFSAISSMSVFGKPSTSLMVCFKINQTSNLTHFMLIHMGKPNLFSVCLIYSVFNSCHVFATGKTSRFIVLMQMTPTNMLTICLLRSLIGI